MDEVEIVDYDPRWPSMFNEEAERLRSVLDPSFVVGLEHFGSTAIPGLSAKPIIDILIAVRSLAEAKPSAAYARLKERLAAEHRMDREAYTDAKSAYVETVMRKAIK